MQETKKEQVWRVKILDLYFFIWILCGILYPLWLVPHSNIQRAIIYGGAIITFYAVRHFLEKTQIFSNVCIEFSWSKICPKGLFKDKYVLILFCIILVALLTILPLLTLPITPRGDEEAHVNFAINLLKNFSIPTEQVFSQDAQQVIKIIVMISAVAVLLVFILNKRKKEANEAEKRPHYLAEAIRVVYNKLFQFYKKYKPIYVIAFFGAYFFFMNLIL